MSEKTIADKMFLKNASSMAIVNGAAHPGVVAQMPAQLINAGDAAVDVVLMFALDRDQLAHYLPVATARLAEKGSLWIAYLKGTASRKTDINRDTINAYATERGVTGVAMIALDSDWSALRLKRI
jgi:hypothetical protein